VPQAVGGPRFAFAVEHRACFCNSRAPRLPRTSISRIVLPKSRSRTDRDARPTGISEIRRLGESKSRDSVGCELEI
jgi:hypothetical protein